MPRNNSKQRREQRRQRITDRKQHSSYYMLLLADASDGLTYRGRHLYYYGEHSLFCQCQLERALRRQANEPH